MSFLVLLGFLIAIGLVIRFVMSAYAQKQQQEQEDQDELDYQLLKRSRTEQTSSEASPPSGATGAAITQGSQPGSSSPDEVVQWAHVHQAPDAPDILHQHTLLTDGRFDFSLESLHHLDDWLESLRVYKDIIPQPLFQSSIYWAGAYFGETLVRLGEGRFRWISWEDHMRDQHESKRNLMPKSFEYHQILQGDNGTAWFPFSKVSKFMDNGPEESTHFLATTVLKP
jgi:hypothetical protein